MIIAKVKSGPQNYLYLKFSNPNEVFTEDRYQVVRGTDQDVRRKLYFRNRKYIIDTLGPWLKQRKRAIEERPDQEEFSQKLEKVTALRDMVLHHTFSSLWSLCAYVIRKRDDISLIAPGESSRHFKYYSTTILPIIEYCEEQSEQK